MPTPHPDCAAERPRREIAAERFDARRAAGTDPCPVQNAIAAFRHVAAFSYESGAQFWRVWSQHLLPGELVRESGAALIERIERIVRRIAGEPIAARGAHAPASLHGASRQRLGEELRVHAEVVSAFNAHMARLEAMAFHADNVGLEECGRALRATIAQAYRQTSEHGNALQSAYDRALQVEADRQMRRARRRPPAARRPRPAKARHG